MIERNDFSQGGFLLKSVIWILLVEAHVQTEVKDVDHFQKSRNSVFITDR